VIARSAIPKVEILHDFEDWRAPNLLRVTLPSPELLAEWADRLAASGFDDIERFPPCRAKGDPSRHAAYYRDYLRSDNPAHDHHISLDVVIEIEEGSHGDVSPVSDIPLWDGPFDYLAEGLHWFHFRNCTDRNIAQAIYDGETWQSVTQRLHVSHSRIARVQRQIREWAQGG
jgi:hypothetical protein